MTKLTVCTAVAFLLCASPPSLGQAPGPSAGTPASAAQTAKAVPADYVIGAEDVLSVVYWRDRDMTAEVTVRPDGKITLPLLNDVHAAGLTPGQLRLRLMEISAKYVEDPNITVAVREMNSHKVYITGGVHKPGPYGLSGPMTVLQLISLAGGLRDFVDGKRIVIFRKEGDRTTTFPFNYKDVVGRKNLWQNIELKPGDTITVPE